MSAPGCILAIDLGTSAFKAASVSPSGPVAEPVVVPYELDSASGRITCPPERYMETALDALRQASQEARDAGYRVEAVGISSQAQTFIPLDRTGHPLSDAIVWLDDRATEEAERASQALPDVSAHCGFRQFTGQQFLPKVMHLLSEGRIRLEDVGKFLLLNEYIALRLTGRAYGDETNQGMGGFYDITERAWSPIALNIAGITSEHLAVVAPAASFGLRLIPALQQTLNLEAIPVYHCGNDQTCAAAGVDLEVTGSVLCNFGTAMVVYTRKDERPAEILETQIAGIDPLTQRYFLLGLEAECGNVVEWLAHRVFPEKGIEALFCRAIEGNDEFSNAHPAFRLLSHCLTSGGLSCFQEAFEGATSVASPAVVARIALKVLRARFLQLLTDVRGPDRSAGRLIASGGLSRSPNWLEFLEQGAGIPFERASTEHPGLLGAARIIESRKE